MRHLGALADRGLLDLHVRAGLGSVEHVGARAFYPCVLYSLFGGVADWHSSPTVTWPIRCVCGHDGVAADNGIGADPGLRGVDEGNALGHPVLVDAVACNGGKLCELDAAVDAQAVAVVVAVEDGDRPAVAL